MRARLRYSCRRLSQSPPFLACPLQLAMVVEGPLSTTSRQAAPPFAPTPRRARLLHPHRGRVRRERPPTTATTASTTGSLSLHPRRVTEITPPASAGSRFAAARHRRRQPRPGSPSRRPVATH